MSVSTEKSLEDDSYKDEITLRELISVLWGGRILIFCLTTFVAVASIIISLSITNVYTSESVLVNRDKQDSPMSNFSGLASLAGVDLSAQGASLNKVMGIIESREFVKHLITFDNVLPSLMAAQSFNANTKEIIFDDEIYNHETKSWVRDAPANRSVVPSYIEAHKEYSEMISMTKDRLTGHVSLKVEHVSPIFAKEFLSLVINEANNVQRNIDFSYLGSTGSYYGSAAGHKLEKILGRRRPEALQSWANREQRGRLSECPSSSRRSQSA